MNWVDIDNLETNFPSPSDGRSLMDPDMKGLFLPLNIIIYPEDRAWYRQYRQQNEGFTSCHFQGSSIKINLFFLRLQRKQLLRSRSRSPSFRLKLVPDHISESFLLINQLSTFSTFIECQCYIDIIASSHKEINTNDNRIWQFNSRSSPKVRIGTSAPCSGAG